LTSMCLVDVYLAYIRPLRAVQNPIESVEIELLGC
jgi:hypothetical protein